MSPEEFASKIRSLPQTQSKDDLVDAKDEVAALFRREQKANFGRMEDSDGNPWPPRKGNPPNPPLYLTGKMYGAATTLGAPGNITEVEHRELTLGIDSGEVPYASKHQFGMGRIPRRQFFYLRKDRLKRARLILRKPLRRIFLVVFRWTKGFPDVGGSKSDS